MVVFFKNWRCRFGVFLHQIARHGTGEDSQQTDIVYLLAHRFSMSWMWQKKPREIYLGLWKTKANMSKPSWDILPNCKWSRLKTVVENRWGSQVPWLNYESSVWNTCTVLLNSMNHLVETYLGFASSLVGAHLNCFVNFDLFVEVFRIVHICVCKVVGFR